MLKKVTFNDPDVTLELEPALTGSVGSKGETVFVSAFLWTCASPFISASTFKVYVSYRETEQPWLTNGWLSEMAELS